MFNVLKYLVIFSLGISTGLYYNEFNAYNKLVTLFMYASIGIAFSVGLLTGLVKDKWGS